MSYTYQKVRLDGKTRYRLVLPNGKVYILTPDQMQQFLNDVEDSDDSPSFISTVMDIAETGAFIATGVDLIGKALDPSSWW